MAQSEGRPDRFHRDPFPGPLRRGFLGLTGLAFAGVVHLETIWRHQLGPGIAKVVSPNFYRELDHSVDQVLTTRRWWWLTVGLVLTLWQVSSGVRALMGALDHIYEVKDRRPFWTRMGLSVLLALQQAFGILSMLVVVMTYLYVASVAFLVGAELDALAVTRADTKSRRANRA